MGAIPPFSFNSRLMLKIANHRTVMSMPIKTRRLELRDLMHDDAPAFARLAGDWDVARMTARIPYPYSEVLAREWMDTLGTDEFVRTVIWQGALIGAVGYVEIENGAAEIGYWIGKPWWGQGFATEAATALVRYCFTTGGFKRLTCCHFTDNDASKRVIQKLGFRSSAEGSAWCDARQGEFPTQSYELNRPLSAVFWRRTA
jgi:ribosomal-protein-alanine N-acetyltransferase